MSHEKLEAEVEANIVPADETDPEKQPTSPADSTTSSLRNRGAGDSSNNLKNQSQQSIDSGEPTSLEKDAFIGLILVYFSVLLDFMYRRLFACVWLFFLCLFFFMC